MATYLKYISGCIFFIALSCTKNDFLQKKPNTNIVVPTSIDDMMQLLDNQDVTLFNSPAMLTLSADEYFYSSLEAFNSVSTKTEKNCFIWNKDIYQGEQKIEDWNGPYQAIFYANVVLEAWNNLPAADKIGDQGKYVRAWALFLRSYNYYSLVQTFCNIYDKKESSSSLGIPLKLSADINNFEQRATLQESYDQIIKDLQESIRFFTISRASKNLNRPSKSAAYALQARIYLSMREYQLAGQYADSSLAVYDQLQDYNDIDVSLDVPFSNYNKELLFMCTTNLSYFAVSVGSNSSMIDTNLVSLYEENDLRRTAYFTIDKGFFFLKAGYNGPDGYYPFTGLAVDEVYLIKSESQVRSGDVAGAILTLNVLLKARYKEGAFIPFESLDPQLVLKRVLEERRKELIWRGIRWTDLKRLNKEGANITLHRVMDGTTFTLPPNDPRYVMPIPDDEIALSHLVQNPR